MSEVTIKTNDIEILVKDKDLSVDQCVSKALSSMKEMGFAPGPEAKTCLFKGELYSPGAIVDAPGGPLTCEGGKWKAK